MVIDTKSELLMVLIGLEQVSELVLEDERAQEWDKRRFTALFNQVLEEYNGLVEEEEQILAELLADGYHIEVGM